MKRILIITYFYAPVGNPRALRWSTLAEYWAAHGYQIDVVCAFQPGSLHDEQRNGVNVFRRNSTLLDRLRSWFTKAPLISTGSQHTRSQTQPENATQLPKSVRKNLTIKAMFAPVRWLFKQLYWPDGGFLWYFPALKQARWLITHNNYEAMITVSNYFTGHLVGVNLHKTFPKLRWIADIGDPFSFGYLAANNRWLYGRLNRWLEGEVIRGAYATSLPTQEVLDTYTEMFPDSTSKMHLIRALIYAQSPAALIADSPIDDKMRLVFAGRLYPNIRRPEFLLKLFSVLVEIYRSTPIELHFYGYSRDVADAFEPYYELLSRQIFIHGEVNHDEVISAMQRANLLINIANDTQYAFDSKLVEYAATRKPILNIYPFEDHSSIAFLRLYPGVLNIRTDLNANMAAVARQVFEFMSNPPSAIDLAVLQEWLSGFGIESVATAYDKLLNST